MDMLKLELATLDALLTLAVFYKQIPGTFGNNPAKKRIHSLLWKLIDNEPLGNIATIIKEHKEKLVEGTLYPPPKNLVANGNAPRCAT